MISLLRQVLESGIGSEEDRAARDAAARIEFLWEEGVVGSKPGVEIWRVEKRNKNGGCADFGIEPWPRKRYGQFHRCDSYIILVTTREDAYVDDEYDEDDEDDGKLLWDVHFWIGSKATKDEYSVAAYKAMELDDLLGWEPMQHHECEGRESQLFVDCFPQGIFYLDEGATSDEGVQKVHLFRVYKNYIKRGERGAARCFEVPLKCSSLNDDDAFLVDAGDRIHTWFGSTVSAFEKAKCAAMAHNLGEKRHGDCEIFQDVENDDEEFWELLGGRGEIRPHGEETGDPLDSVEKKMFVLSDVSGKVEVEEVPVSKSSLVRDDVCIVDVGHYLFIWIGKGSTSCEKQQAMVVSSRYLKELGRYDSTCITRVMEGQEHRCPLFLQVL